MAQNALVRGSIAVAATFAMAVGCAYAAAPLAMADTPTETVIPASLTGPPEDLISFAGPGGFLHLPPGSHGYVWTKYSGGPDIPVPGAHRSYVGDSGAGSDTVATRINNSTVQLQDMDTGATTTIVLPSGEVYYGTFGSTLLTYDRASGGTHLLSMSSGQLTDTPVAGFLSATAGLTPLAGDAHSVVVMYRDGFSDYRLGLIDLATAQLTPLFGTTVPNTAKAVLTDKYIGWYEPGVDTLYLLSRSDPTASATTVHVPLVQQPTQAFDVRQLAIAGDSLLIAYDWSTSTSDPAADKEMGYPLYQMPLSGGTPTPVVDHALSTALVPLAPTSGGALIDGGPSLAGWGVQRVTSTNGAAPVATSAYSDPWGTAPLGGVSLADGQLFTVEADNRLFSRTVQLGGAAPSYSTHTFVTTTAQISDCSSAASCVPPIATGDGGIAQRVPNSSGDLIAVQGQNWIDELPTGVTDSSLVDSDGRYVVYNSASAGKQYVGDTRTNPAKVVFSRSAGAAALWESTLWTAGSTAGTLNAIDLSTQATVRTVDTGASCVPSELQAAVGRWIYWSCGASGPAGVYDLATGKDVTVPSAGLAQLGDGFVVEHDTARGELVLTDVHSDTAVTSDLAALPADTAAPDDRRVTWAVDRYPGGGIAYTDAQSNIHLVDPHIPASPAMGSILLPGQRLNPGDSLNSGSMRLVMQSDGNLVAYLKTGGKSGPAMWASGTYGNPGAYLTLTNDGVLVIHSSDGSRALWSTATGGSPGAYLTLQDDGNLVLYRQATSDSPDALWNTGTYARQQTISSGETLKPGWWTQGTRTVLVMQADGNLVMYRKRDGAAIWASGTWGRSGAYGVMQTDGNLVIYPKGGGPSSHDALWASGTWGHFGAYAVMQNDGNLVIYPKGGGPSSHDALWASNTWQTAK